MEIARPVICRCRNVFCFYCGENWHDPVKCNLLKKWIKKCDDDSETSNWIAANTKVGERCCALFNEELKLNILTFTEIIYWKVIYIYLLYNKQFQPMLG